MMPEDGLDTLAAYDEIYLGALGWPTVPDHLSLWGLLLPIRRKFDQYVNLRPTRRGEDNPLRFRGGEGPTGSSGRGDQVERYQRYDAVLR